jgi:hypothetical protein
VTRIVNAPNATELAKSGVIGCVMVDLDFASGHVYLNDGIMEIVYGGHTFSPLGQFGGVEVIEEQLDTIARPVVLKLSGVDASLVGTAQNEIYQNRSAVLYLALINQQTGALVANPETAWEGRMDYMQIDIDRGKGAITLNCEHRLRREPRIARYTDADQQNAYSGDTFFGFTADIAGFKSQWGNEKATYAGPGTGGATNRPNRPGPGGGR